MANADEDTPSRQPLPIVRQDEEPAALASASASKPAADAAGGSVTVEGPVIAGSSSEQTDGNRGAKARRDHAQAIEQEEQVMAEPTLVNGQITDAVTQADVATLGNAPAMAIATLYQTTVAAVTLSVQSAVANQQALNGLMTAILSQSVQALQGSSPKAG